MGLGDMGRVIELLHVTYSPRSHTHPLTASHSPELTRLFLDSSTTSSGFSLQGTPDSARQGYTKCNSKGL